MRTNLLQESTNSLYTYKLHREWVLKVPYLRMRDNWLVSPSPANNVLCRFRVSTHELILKNKDISVYFDVDDSLGIMGQPYWEVYGLGMGEPERFVQGEEGIMLNRIQELLEEAEAAL